MTELLKNLDEFHRRAHGVLLGDDLFFTEQRFKENYGKIMLQQGLKSAMEKQIKDLQNAAKN